MEHALLDSLACSRLLRGTGLTPVQIRSAMARARPGWSTPSTSSISAWMRPESHTRAPTLPRDDLRAWLAEAVGVPVTNLLWACAGLAPRAGIPDAS